MEEEGRVGMVAGDYSLCPVRSVHGQPCVQPGAGGDHHGEAVRHNEWGDGAIARHLRTMYITNIHCKYPIYDTEVT